MTTNSLRMMPALPFSAALAVGIVIGYYVSAQRFAWLLTAVAAVLCLASCFLKNRQLRTGFLCAASLSVGILLMTLQKERLYVALPDYRVQANAVVIEPARESAQSWTADFLVTDGSMKGRKLRCYIKKETQTMPLLGATYTLKGRLRPFNADISDGNFNYQRWADSHSLTAQMTVYAGNITRTADVIDGLPFMERVMLKSKMLRAALLKRLNDNGLEGTSHAVVAAMAFGDRSMLAKETCDEYSRTGVAHLLALSGMHLGVLFMLLTLVFGRLRNRLLRCVIIVVTVWTYVVFVGMPASVVRAATMLTIYSLVSVSGRDRMSVNALFVTFALMLLFNPMMIWDVGFQLSFLAVLSIFVFFPPIYNMVSTEFLFEHPLLRFVWSTATLSLAAQIGTSPLSAYYFGRFPLMFLLTNLVAIPLVTVLLYAAFLLVLFSAVPVLGSLTMLSVKACAWLLSSAIGVFASWEWSNIDDISINWMQLMLIYAVMTVLTWMSARLIRR
jgi:competence protein ComEC